MVIQQLGVERVKLVKLERVMLGSNLCGLERGSVRAGKKCTKKSRFLDTGTGQMLVERFRCMAHDWDRLAQNSLGASRQLGGGATSNVAGRRRVQHSSGDQVDGRDPHMELSSLLCMGNRGGEQALRGVHSGVAIRGKISSGRDDEIRPSRDEFSGDVRGV